MKTMISIFIKATVALALMLSFSSCEDFLKEKSYDFVQPADIEDSDNGAKQLFIGVYSQISSMFNSNTFPMTWMYDEDYLTGPSWAFGYLGAGNYLNDGYIPNYWTGLYTLIHKANYTAYRLNLMENVTPEVKTKYLGELSFLKAWSYYMLVRAFGPVPVRKKSISETGEQDVPRSPVMDVYGYILELLDDAMKMCPKNTDEGFETGMISAGAAAGLKVKVLCTIGSASLPAGTEIWVPGGIPFLKNGADKAYTDPQKIRHKKELVAGFENVDSKAYYEKAYKLAEEIIKGDWGTYALVPYDQLWGVENAYGPEQMWSYRGTTGDTRYCEWFSYHISGIKAGSSDDRVYDGMWYGGRDHWYKLMEPQDYRALKGVRHRWERVWDATIAQYYPNNIEYNNKVANKEAPYDDGKFYVCPQFDVYYLAYPTKYDNRTSTTDTHGDAFWPLLRYADIELLYAEAYAECNGTADGKALDALNRVRTRNNATPYSLTGVVGISDMVDFRSTVLRERSLEMFCEGDRRWDLIRWGVFVQVMSAIGGQDEIGVNKMRYERHKLFPIPKSETDANESITENNPGWD